MIRLVVYKDMYFPLVDTKKNTMVARVASYYVFKERHLDFEKLHALVSHEFGGRTSPRLKRFLHSYVKKLEAYGLVEVYEENGEKMIVAKAFALPIRWMLHGVLNDPTVRRKVSKRTLQAWRRGERKPDLGKLLEVVT